MHRSPNKWLYYWSSVLIMFRVKSDRLSSIFIGLILYAIIIELPGVKNCINEIYVEDTEICIFDSVRMDENITLKKGDFNNLLQLFMNMKRDEDIFIMEHKRYFKVKLFLQKRNTRCFNIRNILLFAESLNLS